MSTPISKISNLLSEKVRDTNQVIKENIGSKETPIIGDIASHLINSGGKRIRPLLTLAVSKLFDYQGDKDTFLAAAIETCHESKYPLPKSHTQFPHFIGLRTFVKT